jgi:LuxR family maltose regulon positive regulatory protein
VLSLQFRLETIPTFLKEIEDLLAKGNPEMTAADLAITEGRLQSFWSQNAFFTNDYHGAILHGQQGLNFLPVNDLFCQGYCLMYQAMALKKFGQDSEAITLLETNIWKTGEFFNSKTVRLAMALCQIYSELGYLDQAKHTSQYLLENATQKDFYIGAAWGKYFLGRVFLEQGDFDQALFHFKSVSEAPYRAHIRTAHDCFLGLALIYQVKGAANLADRVLEAAEVFALDTQNHSHLVEVQSLRARLALQRGQAEEAFRILEFLFDKSFSAPYIFLELPQLTLARIWLSLREPAYLERALTLLDRMLETAASSRNTWRLVEIHAVRALANFQCGEPEKALMDLEQAVALAKHSQMIQMLYELKPELHVMLAEIQPSGKLDAALDRLFSQIEHELQSSPFEELTRREIEVLELLGKRSTYEEIATSLFISHSTVKTHTRNIYQKLNVGGRREALAMARQLGILKD